MFLYITNYISRDVTQQSITSKQKELKHDNFHQYQPLNKTDKSETIQNREPRKQQEKRQHPSQQSTERKHQHYQKIPNKNKSPLHPTTNQRTRGITPENREGCTESEKRILAAPMKKKRPKYGQLYRGKREIARNGNCAEGREGWRRRRKSTAKKGKGGSAEEREGWHRARMEQHRRTRKYCEETEGEPRITSKVHRRKERATRCWLALDDSPYLSSRLAWVELNSENKILMDRFRFA